MTHATGRDGLIKACPATFTPEVHPRIVWAKFEALAEGARRATTRLWSAEPSA